MRDKIEKELKETFRPEFLNRLDEIVYFSSLSNGELEQITEKLLSQSISRIERLGVQVVFTPAVIPWFATQFAKKDAGARALRNALQRELEDPFATGILENRFPFGSKVTIDIINDRLRLLRTSDSDSDHLQEHIKT